MLVIATFGLMDTSGGPGVQFIATEEGQGRTRLTVRANNRKVEQEAAEWVRRDLGGTPWNS